MASLTTASAAMRLPNDPVILRECIRQMADIFSNERLPILQQKLGLHPKETLLVDRLYAAAGPLGRTVLQCHLFCGPKQISVHLAKTRKDLGPDLAQGLLPYKETVEMTSPLREHVHECLGDFRRMSADVCAIMGTRTLGDIPPENTPEERLREIYETQLRYIRGTPETLILPDGKGWSSSMRLIAGVYGKALDRSAADPASAQAPYVTQTFLFAAMFPPHADARLESPRILCLVQRHTFRNLCKVPPPKSAGNPNKMASFPLSRKLSTSCAPPRAPPPRSKKRTLTPDKTGYFACAQTSSAPPL